MEALKIYNDMAKRTGGDMYIGVVGPVRSGKSTFINRFMETSVIPNIVDEYGRKRARDELPQSAEGKTVMTAEPKFIPDEAVVVEFGDAARMRMRMIDCVGYLIPGALGMTEDGEARMVKTPWSDEPIPFETAAKEGTDKVMLDHSTVGMLVTCDGSFGELPRESYEAAEEMIAEKLKAIGKPFVLVLNSAVPDSREAESLAVSLEKKYSCPVALVNCRELDETDIQNIFEMLLYEFPIKDISVSLPDWVSAIPATHSLNTIILKCLRESSENVRVLSDGAEFCKKTEELLSRVCTGMVSDPKVSATINRTDLCEGAIGVELKLPEELYYKMICDLTGLPITSQSDLLSVLVHLSDADREFEKYREATAQLASDGYGIVMPKIEDLVLEEPEIIKSSGAYGVRICARAESVHMIKADLETSISPIVGTQEQAEEMIQRLISEYEDDPVKLWSSNIFGKTIYELVSDGLDSKIKHLSAESREKLSETLSRIVNESSNGLICILL